MASLHPSDCNAKRQHCWDNMKRGSLKICR